MALRRRLCMWLCGLWQRLWDWLASLFSLSRREVVTFPNTGIVVEFSSPASSHTHSHTHSSGSASGAGGGSDAHAIGEGAYSVVLRARDRQSPNKSYAVKRMLLQSSECMDMARREIAAFARFQGHRHVLPLLDHLETTDSSNNNNSHNSHSRVLLLLLPLCAEGSLRLRLDRTLRGETPRLPLRSVLRQFLAVCEAVNVLHTHSPPYVHQDIKPDNVLLDSELQPLLTDFGSVRLADVAINSRNDALRVADEAARFCTASYRAPELFDPPKGIMLDSRTDVWSLGCLLFAMWIGYSPFECEFLSSGANALRVVECTPLRVLAGVPRMPLPSKDDLLVYELVEWILQQEMRRRPFTVDIIDRLRRTIDSLDDVRVSSLV